MTTRSVEPPFSVAMPPLDGLVAMREPTSGHFAGPMYKPAILGVAVAGAIAIGRIIAMTSYNAGPTVEEIGLYVGAWLLTAVVSVSLIMRASPITQYSGPIVFVPIVVTASIMSFLTADIGSLLPHQVVWALLGVVFVLAVTADNRIGPSAGVPGWLVVFMAFGLLQPFAGSDMSALYGVGLTVVGLWIAWLVACALPAEGGLTKFLGAVAGVYWTVTVVAILVKYSGISLGAMTPKTVTLPWQAALNHNYQGYGIVSTQGGRELSLIVCVYHLVRWRFKASHRGIHAALGTFAFGAFMTGYGRVAFLGGLIALAVVVGSSLRRTHVAAVVAVVVCGCATLLGTGSSGGLLALRIGAPNWASGHFLLWSQQLNLFALQPLTGVGSKVTGTQLSQASQNPLVAGRAGLTPEAGAAGLTPEALANRGSRGEGGWTGLWAQDGILAGGVIGALLIVGAMGMLSPMWPRSRESRQDLIMLRALIPASWVFYISDLAPLGVTNFSAYVMTQVTIIGVVMAIRQRRGVQTATRAMARTPLARRARASWDATA